MTRAATINVSLTPEELRLVHKQVESGHYASASEVIREGLRELFSKDLPMRGLSTRSLAAGYRATRDHDRKLARDWAQLPRHGQWM
jgi:putative addiction module CopG family antidote